MCECAKTFGISRWRCLKRVTPGLFEELHLCPEGVGPAETFHREAWGPLVKGQPDWEHGLGRELSCVVDKPEDSLELFTPAQHLLDFFLTPLKNSVSCSGNSEDHVTLKWRTSPGTEKDRSCDPQEENA